MTRDFTPPDRGQGWWEPSPVTEATQRPELGKRQSLGKTPWQSGLGAARREDGLTGGWRVSMVANKAGSNQGPCTVESSQDELGDSRGCKCGVRVRGGVREGRDKEVLQVS